jgi:hypothetical protein
MERKGVHVIEKNVETCQNSGSDYILYLVDGYLQLPSVFVSFWRREYTYKEFSEELLSITSFSGRQGQFIPILSH